MCRGLFRINTYNFFTLCFEHWSHKHTIDWALSVEKYIYYWIVGATDLHFIRIHRWRPRLLVWHYVTQKIKWRKNVLCHKQTQNRKERENKNNNCYDYFMTTTEMSFSQTCFRNTLTQKRQVIFCSIFKENTWWRFWPIW